MASNEACLLSAFHIIQPPPRLRFFPASATVGRPSQSHRVVRLVEFVFVRYNGWDVVRRNVFKKSVFAHSLNKPIGGFVKLT